jgi:uncharacterized protein YcfL
MANHSLKKISLLFAVSLALGGCATGPYEPQGDSKSAETAGAKAVILDEGLVDKVAVDKVSSGKKSSGLLFVQANIRNRTRKDIEIQAQTVYKDAGGLSLYSSSGNEAAWTTLVLTANGTTTYRSQATSPVAEQFTIRLRLLHRP